MIQLENANLPSTIDFIDIFEIFPLFNVDLSCAGDLTTAASTTLAITRSHY